MKNRRIDLDGMIYPLPGRETLLRLGCNLHKMKLAPEQQTELDAMMRRAFALCRPRGRWMLKRVEANDGSAVVCEDGFRVASARFAGLAEGAEFLWVAGATVGAEVVRAVQESDDVAFSAICDAVASESADAAMDFLQRSATQELKKEGLLLAERRYSPGYGDMALAHQRAIFAALTLEELGLRLTETDFITPEKSVTAFAAVRSQGALS